MNSKYKKIFLILFGILVLFVVGIVAVKKYKLSYCATKYPAGTGSRVRCIDEPLYKFIFK